MSRTVVDSIKFAFEHFPFTLIGLCLVVAFLIWAIENRKKIGGIAKAVFWVYLALAVTVIVLLWHIYVASVEMIEEGRVRRATALPVAGAPMTTGAPAPTAVVLGTDANNPIKLKDGDCEAFVAPGEPPSGARLGQILWIQTTKLPRLHLEGPARWVKIHRPGMAPVTIANTNDGVVLTVPLTKRFGIEFLEPGSLTIDLR